MTDSIAFLSKWSVPIGVLTSVMGGSAWLTTTHNTVEHIQAEAQEIKEDIREHKSNIYEKLYNQDQRLSRIEGKLDLLVDEMVKVKRARHQP